MDYWAELQPHLQQLLGSEDYHSWIEPLTVASSADSTLALACDNDIVAEWVRDHLLRDIETVARSRFGADFRVIIASGDNEKDPLEPEQHHVRGLPFTSAFTFERFVQGPPVAAGPPAAVWINPPQDTAFSGPASAESEPGAQPGSSAGALEAGEHLATMAPTLWPFWEEKSSLILIGELSQSL